MHIETVGVIVIIIIFMIIIKIFKNKSKRNKICDLVYFFDEINPFDYIKLTRNESQTLIQKNNTWAEKYASKKFCWVGFIREISEQHDKIIVEVTIYYKDKTRGYINICAYYSFSISLYLPKSQKEQLLFFHKYDGVRFKCAMRDEYNWLDLYTQKLEKIGVKEYEFKRFLVGDN